jgi:hypothetical protein
MSAIDVRIEPHRVTRVFFGYCDAGPNLADQRRIRLAIERSIALAEADDAMHMAIIIKPSAATKTARRPVTWHG